MEGAPLSSEDSYQAIDCYMQYLNLKQQLLDKIKARGGWVNAHAHFDRAFTITEKNFHLGSIDFQKKWALNQKIITESTTDQIYDRMALATERMIDQGVYAVSTFIDVNPGVKDRSIKAAQKVREKYKDDIIIKYINQSLQGVIKKEAREWFKVGADFVDIIGGLPSKDAGHEAEHLDILLSTAKKMNKMVHVHVDQLNDPKEQETELLTDKTVTYGMEGKVVAIHSISVGAQPKEYRTQLYKKMNRAGLMVVANPTAYIDDGRKEIMVPSHNSITPVDEMVPEGIVVVLGTDNIADLHKPFTDGDMWIELRVLLEVCRFQDLDQLVNIATVNGRKVLGLID